MADTSKATTDRQALLVAKQDAYLSWLGENNKSKLSLWKKVIFCAFIAFIACIIVIIWYIGIFDVSHKTSSSKPGMIGLWPSYGGDSSNTQTPPFPHNVRFTQNNIKNLSTHCIYDSENGVAVLGYPTVDDDNNTYFSDGSGYITCVNLDSCNLCWRNDIANLLGLDDYTIVSHHTMTIFRDSDGNEGLLFGAPTVRGWLGMTNYPSELGCYALAVHKNNGSFWWKVQIGEDYKDQDYGCTSHGFYVDDKYAYGGITQSCCYDFGENNDKKTFIGRFVKIDIDKHEIVSIWYPFDYDLTISSNWDEYNLSYQGCSSYNFPAIMDDYVVFGTSNLWRIPYTMQQCLTANSNTTDLNQYLLFNESLSMDICGNDKSENKFFRCLPKNKVYPSSLIVLNKNTFKLQNAHILQGVDVYNGIARFSSCLSNPRYDQFCSGYYVNKSIIGFNADLTAVAIYKNKLNNKKYVVASSKPTRLHVFELETGKLHFTKKYGPQAGTAQWGIAIDEDSMIAITSILGIGINSKRARYKLANNLTVCNGTGSVIAFDLNSGTTLWQIVNPYGTINESICFNDTLYEDVVDYVQQEDTTCDSDTFDDDKNAFVRIPPLLNETQDPFYTKSRSEFKAPVTISNNMVFIASNTGNIYVHDLYNGSFIHQFQCPPQFVNGTYNRAGIRGGISVFNDRIVFYCGAYPNTEGTSLEYLKGNKLVSMKLQLS